MLRDKADYVILEGFLTTRKNIGYEKLKKQFNHSFIPCFDDLEQGDVIENCNVIMPNEKSYEAMLNDDILDVPVEKIDGIVLSQSCDISNDKIDSIILCPILPLRQIKKFEDKREMEILRRGNSPAYHLLNRFGTETLEEDYYVVDFHHIYSVPKKFIETLAKSQTRKRLPPPYCEHLSQSFARYFMRVGLPSGISEKEIREYPSLTAI